MKDIIQLFKHSFKRLFVVLFVANVVKQGITILVTQQLQAIVRQNSAFLSSLNGVAIVILWLALLSIITLLVAGVLDNAYQRYRMPFSNIFKAARKRFWAMFVLVMAVFLLMNIVTSLALMVTKTPLVALIVMMALIILVSIAPFILLLEEQSPLMSLKLSFFRTRHALRQSLLYILLPCLLYLAVDSLLLTLGFKLTQKDAWSLDQVVNIFADTLTLQFLACSVYVYYRFSIKPLENKADKETSEESNVVSIEKSQSTEDDQS